MKTIIIDGIEYNLTPKLPFKKGDWVVLSTSDGEKVVQIDSIEHFKSGEQMYITSEGRWFGNGTKAHLWTIQDAKDGDVLSSDNSIFIFQEEYIAKKPIAYCGLMNGRFIEGKDACWTNEKYYPATKEQRDTLIKAMTDAGWGFDFEKKELKKIKQKSQRMVSAEAKEALYDKPAWSEEDEKTLNEIFSVAARASLRESTLFGKSYDYIKWQNWLKSIKERYTWKPSKEQIEALHDLNLTGDISYMGQARLLIELYNDLKKLTE